MHFEKDFIEKVKESTDLFDLVKEYAPDLKYTTRNVAQCKCPHPNHNDKTPSFTVYMDGNTWNCYGCNASNSKSSGGEGSDCIAFIQWMNQGSMSWQDSVKFLANRAGIPLPDDDNRHIFDSNFRENNAYVNNLKKHPDALNYLYNRGLNDIDIDKWKIGYDEYFNRITFPLFDVSKNIIGFNKRIIKQNRESNEVKYWHSKNSEIFNKSKYFYGLHNINKKVKYIIVTEGVMDVIIADKYKVPNVVCTLGTSFSQEHIKVIKRLNLSPIIIYDNDNAGNSSTLKVMELLLENNIYCKVCKLPEGYDLGELCSQCKSTSNQYIEDNSYTYGYSQIKNIIDNYNKDLYELKLKYRPIIEESLSKVPIFEKNNIKAFLNEEIGIKV